MPISLPRVSLLQFSPPFTFIHYIPAQIPHSPAKPWSTLSRINVSISWRKILNKLKIQCHLLPGVMWHLWYTILFYYSILMNYYYYYYLLCLDTHLLQIRFHIQGTQGWYLCISHFFAQCLTQESEVSQYLLMNQWMNIERWTQLAAVVTKLLTTGCHSLCETSCPVLSRFTVAFMPEGGLDASH